jgi:hypothetical protein
MGSVIDVQMRTLLIIMLAAIFFIVLIAALAGYIDTNKINVAFRG